MASSKLSSHELVSIIYHDIFDYPLDKNRLQKWKAGSKVSIKQRVLSVKYTNGCYFLKGKDKLVGKKIKREKISKNKFEIAKKVGKWLEKIPSIKMIAVTGSLAMNNARKESDIDLMIITKRGSLWTTRLMAFILLQLSGFKLRRAGKKTEKDKICMNIWMDEEDLIIEKSKRNIYTAHEVAQIVPLVNKDKTYEKFVNKNKWILAFWPNAVEIQNSKFKILNSKKKVSFVFRISNLIAYKMQYLYMRNKITREVVTPTRAFFHPVDWGAKVVKELEKRVT